MFRLKPIAGSSGRRRTGRDRRGRVIRRDGAPVPDVRRETRPARAPDLGGRTAPVRSALVDPPPPRQRAGTDRAQRHAVHQRGHPDPLRLLSGLVAQVTGGDPGTTGVYYDDSYNRRLLPPGSSCTPGQTSGLGAEVNFSEVLDRNLNSIDAGAGIRTSTRASPPACLRCPAASPRSSSG